MHIKRVTINGFTSYEQLTMESGKQLSKGCNLILGLNGCGKSNFLQGKSTLGENASATLEWHFGF